MWGCKTPLDSFKTCLFLARRDSGAGVVQKHATPVWEAKRQAVQSQLERERSEPPREPTSGQVLHEAVLRAMLPGLEGLEGGWAGEGEAAHAGTRQPVVQPVLAAR